MEQTLDEIISDIFTKDRLTGKELGKLVIDTMIYDIKYFNTPYYKQTFTKEELNILQKRLATAKDHRIYQEYMDIYIAITNTYNGIINISHNLYNHGYWRARNTLEECIHAECANDNDKFMPVIMTEVQYNRLARKAINELSERKETTSSLVIKCLDYFLNHKKEAPAEIKEALEECKLINGTNSSYYGRYRDFHEEGYYILPNGARSDEMTAEEWEREIKEYRSKSYRMMKRSKKNIDYDKFNNDRMLQVYELIYNGRDYLHDFYFDKTFISLNKEEEKELLNALVAMTNNEPAESKALIKILPYVDFLNRGSYRRYTEPPKGISMYDMLSIYVTAYKKGEDKKAVKCLSFDASNLYTAITDYIEQHIAHAKGLLYHGSTTWRELAELDFLDYKMLLSMKERAIIDVCLTDEDREKARFNGIAVIHNENICNVDENENYKQPAIPNHFGITLELLNEDKQRQSDFNECIDKLVKKSLKYMYAYNEVLNIIGRVYDLPGLGKGAKYDTKEYEEAVITFNNMLYSLYCTLDGTKEEKKHKRHIIKKCFQTINLESLKPTTEEINIVESAMNKNNLFEGIKSLDPIINFFIEPKD